MSAENWRVCPRCTQIRDQKSENLRTKADASYGKVSQEEYLRMLEKIGELEQEITDETLREDFEIGTTQSGDFFVNYHSSCGVCRFTYSFKCDKNVFARDVK